MQTFAVFFNINYLIFLNLDICEPFSYLLILTPLVYFTVKRFVISYLSSQRIFEKIYGIFPTMLFILYKLYILSSYII